MKKIITAVLVSSFVIASSSLTQAQPIRPAPANSPVVNVIIENNQFIPNTLTIHVGQTVNWINRDPVSHTISSPYLESNAPNQVNPGQAYSFQFTQPGDYHYVSQLQPNMRGEIIVK